MRSLLAHATVATVLGLVLLACGGHPPPPTAVSIAIPPPSATAPLPVPPAPPVEVALPRAAAVAGSLDLGKLDARALDAALAAPLHALADLADVDAADYPTLLRSVGVDIKRPVAFAVAEPSDDQRHAVEALRTLVGGDPSSAPPAPAGIYDKLREGLASAGSLLAIRVLVPTVDAARLKAAIGVALGHEWHKGAAGEYKSRFGQIALAGDGDTVVVDVALSRDSARDDAAGGIAALRAEVARGHGSAIALNGRLATVHISPAAVAPLAFLSGVTTTVRAVSGISVAPEQKDRISAQGLWEASQCFVLAGTSKGAFFDGIDMDATYDGAHFALALHAVPGPGFVGPSDAAWAPSASVAPADLASRMLVDMAMGFTGGWPLPGDGPGGPATSKFERVWSDAGSVAWPVTMPDLAPGFGRTLAKELDRVLPVPGSVDRFERIGIVVDEDHEVWLAVLPPKTTRDAAECVLGPPRCGKDLRVPVGTTRQVTTASGSSSWFFRVEQVGKRFALLAGRNKESLGIKLAPTTAGPATFELGGRALAEVVDRLKLSGLHLTRVSGTLERRGSDVVMTLATQ